jgi:hypothetical protein
MGKFNIQQPNNHTQQEQTQVIHKAKDLSFEDLLASDNLDNNNTESGEFTLASLWNSICDKEDIIIVIDKVDELRVRKQLSSLKAKENAKLKSAGIRPDDTTLEFIEHKDFTEKEKIKLQIILKHKPTVKVHKMIIAKD